MNKKQTERRPNDGFLRLPQVLKIIPIGKSSWWNGIRAGRYPKGVKIAAGTTVWRVSDIYDLYDKLSSEVLHTAPRTPTKS